MSLDAFAAKAEAAPGSPGNLRGPVPVWALAFVGLGFFDREPNGEPRVTTDGTKPVYYPPENRPEHFNEVMPVFPSCVPSLQDVFLRDTDVTRAPVVVFLSFEALCQSHEGDQLVISEMGLTFLDLDLLAQQQGKSHPGRRGENLQSIMRSQHYIVKQFMGHHTGKGGQDATCHDPTHISRLWLYAFGKSQYIDADQIRYRLDKTFTRASQLHLTKKQVQNGEIRDVIVAGYDAQIVEGVLAHFQCDFYRQRVFYQIWDIKSSPLLTNVLPAGIQLGLCDLAQHIGLQTTVNNFNVTRNSGNDSALAGSIFLALLFLSREEVKILGKGKGLFHIRRPRYVEYALARLNYPGIAPADGGRRIAFTHYQHPHSEPRVGRVPGDIKEEVGTKEEVGIKREIEIKKECEDDNY
ncbi:hypothetical protein JX265_004842 [Neoarthrinium moseri]|uniref:Gfd2/YDR514C-like C-terminal domain-containing protein n=1 Tax=Neoarthrinium moseri TaxID=1658444 RepID=A0A9P9WQD0_9PEZI|nr:uncharacterized protein JN550_003656 [Neoarthrinium moseri]KAI1846872.1 hypothetical protein JX266_007093 [Neoarthrinium moseri]KAI1872782.1 hypothetical protein JN550_003656 [Neoarthrinium moseri]KAI1874634.1 hypothetical protein JX265_004842 [Neoarthrinium moseri]